MPSPRTALITGITGQDGSFLAELLLEKGYAVTGVARQSAPAGTAGGLGASEHLRSELELVQADLLVADSVRAAIERVCPDEIYHLAAPSFVPASWERPEQTMTAIAGSCAAVLETVREMGAQARVFVASSGAMFGDTRQSPQNEDTDCRPTTPYAIAKLAAHRLVGALRDHDGLHASSGIAYNHESERRPPEFVSRRITRAAAAIALGLEREVTLGSLDAVRDWSFAGDVVRGAWMMLQQERAGDYVLASGVAHTVADLARVAFECVGLDAERYVRVDPELERAVEPTLSIGDPSRAHRELGWAPSVGFEQLVQRMVDADLSSLRLASAGS